MTTQLITNWRAFPAKFSGGVLSIGNFDGVHAGHAKMLSTGRDQATRRNVPLTIMTFDPHPAVILRPGVERIPLTTLEQRQELLQTFSPDVLLVVPATREFLSMEAEKFLTDVVQKTIGAKVLVEGPSFTYGRGAKGTIDTLRNNGPAHGFETVILPTQETVLSDMTIVNVSSSLTRWLVENGRVRDAARCLARPYALRGTVIQGQQRGRGLGFPTANIAPTQLLPAAGIYAGRARLPDNRSFPAAISIGTNPTFDGKTTTVEAYLLDFDADLYGKVIDLEFHHWLREMLPYARVAPLIQQIRRDVNQTRQLLQFTSQPAASPT